MASARTVFSDESPGEIILTIFKSCESLEHLHALTMASRRLNAIWQANAGVIIAEVAPRLIPAFDRALMAVRAIARVYEAECKGVLPPVIRPQDLSGRVCLPTPSELRDVRGLHHFVRCLEHRSRHNHIPDSGIFLPEAEARRFWSQRPALTPGTKAEYHEPKDLAAWREQFDRAAYTSLLLGAALARAYAQPFIGEAGLTQLGDKTLVLMLMSYAASGRQNPVFTDEEIRQLFCFPAYDPRTIVTRKKVEVFGPLADWFVASVREDLRGRQDRATTSPSTNTPRQPGTVRRNMKLFDMDASEWPWIGDLTKPYYRARGSGDKSDGTDGQARASDAKEREAVFWELARAMHMAGFIGAWSGTDRSGSLGSHPQQPWVDTCMPTPPPKEKSRSVHVVRIGVYHVEQAILHIDPADSADSPIYVDSRVGTKWPLPDKSLVVTETFRQAFSHISSYGERLVQSPVHFFMFMLRRQFNLRVMGYRRAFWLEHVKPR